MKDLYRKEYFMQQINPALIPNDLETIFPTVVL
jgi:hypothetical protein